MPQAGTRELVPLGTRLERTWSLPKEPAKRSSAGNGNRFGEINFADRLQNLGRTPSTNKTRGVGFAWLELISEVILMFVIQGKYKKNLHSILLTIRNVLSAEFLEHSYFSHKASLGLACIGKIFSENKGQTSKKAS